MNIIPVINGFMAEIFLAAEKFLENPVELSELEGNLSVIGNKTLAGIMGQILNEADTFLQGEPRRTERYTVQLLPEETAAIVINNMPPVLKNLLQVVE